MPVRLTVAKCPSCGQPIQGKVADLVFLCDCGVLHVREEGSAHQVYYEIATPNPAAPPPSAMYYIPFWRLDSQVAIHYERSEGGFFHKLFGKDWKGGRVSIFVPAMDMEPGAYKQWASTITSNPPRYDKAPSFGAYERMPVTIDEGEAKQMADFLVLTFEAEKPGVLQEISYEVKVEGASLLYIPFYRDPGSFRPML